MTNDEYMDEIKDLKTFLEILEKYNDVAEFSIWCAIHGVGDFATKEFFDTKLFKFMSLPDLRRDALALQVALRHNIVKLDRFYHGLVDAA